MTTLTQPAPVTGSQGAQSIPMSRLIRVELRKLVDTRAGFWVAASVALIAAIVAVAMLISNRNDPSALTFGQFFTTMNIPTGIILPVMSILLVTSEWGQRTALTTFTMEPRRERIVIAKLVTAVIAAIAAVVVSLMLAAVATVVAGIAFANTDGSWSFGAASLVNSVTLQLFGMLLGFAFAALILNTPGAIVAYFALPTAFAIVTQLVPWFSDHLGQWVDIGLTNAPFQSGDWASGGEWAKLIVSGVIWIGIPMVVGVTRIVRSEVK